MSELEEKSIFFREIVSGIGRVPAEKIDAFVFASVDECNFGVEK